MNRDQMISQLLDTMNVAKRSMFAQMHSIMQNCPIPPSHLELLGNIANLQPISSKQLALQLQLTPGAISQLVDSLEQRHYIIREPGVNDRRVHYLSVSAEGSQLLDSIQKPRQQLIQQLVNELTDDELAVWLRIQQKMIDKFQSLGPEKAVKLTNKGDTK